MLAAPSILRWVVTLLVVALANGQDCSQYQNEKTLYPGVSLRYVVNAPPGEPAKMSVEMEAIGFQGWLAFGPSPNGMMIGAESVIGLPDNTGGVVEKYILESKFFQGVNTVFAQTLENTTLEQTTAGTTMRYTKLLEEPNEIPILLGQPNTFIWAIGGGNSFFQFHKWYNKVTLDIFACGTVSTMPPTGAPSAFSGSTEPTSTPTPIPRQLDCSNFQQTIQLTPSSYFSYLVFEDEDAEGGGYFKGEMVYEGRGWLGFGSGPTGGSMIGGEAIIGLPDEALSDDNPGKYYMIGKRTSQVTLMDSLQQTLINSTITQNDTHTVLSFIKLLVEERERPILHDGKNTFLWAYGEEDSNTLGYHRARGHFEITLQACNSGEDEIDSSVRTVIPKSYNSYWAAHGVMAAIAWGVAVPLAVSSSLLRNLLPGKATWFKLHMFLNVFALIATLISVIVAIAAQSQQTPDGQTPRHFDSFHHTAGFGIVGFVLIQVTNGYLRPSNKEGDTETKATARVAWEFFHRIAGGIFVIIGLFQVLGGLVTYEDRYGGSDYRIFYVIWVGILVIAVGGLKLMVSRRSE